MISHHTVFSSYINKSVRGIPKESPPLKRYMKKIIQIELKEDSFFTKNYLKSFLVQNQTSPSAAETSKGLRFIVLASFHDAKIIDINVDNIIGKDCVSIVVDFRNTSTEFKAGYQKFYIRFLDVKDMTLPDKIKDLYILDIDCMQEASDLQVVFELVYFIGNQSCHDICKINFTDVQVMPLNKLKS